MDLGNGFINAISSRRIKKSNDLIEQQNLLIWHSMNEEQQNNYLEEVNKQKQLAHPGISSLGLSILVSCIIIFLWIKSMVH